MARRDPLMTMTIKIHPRYAGKILEALELAQVTAHTGPGDHISRVCAASDYSMAADVVARDLGAHMAKAPGHQAWTRWLASRVIAFALKRAPLPPKIKEV